MTIVTRPATRADIAEIHRLSQAFGGHGGWADWVTVTPERLEAVLFGPQAWCAAHMAEAKGGVVGMALWFMNFNFASGRPGLYLEDLFVDAAARGSGAGEALMRALAAEAIARDCVWMDWLVSINNSAGQRFYRRLGAAPQEEWQLWRLERAAIEALAQE